MLVPLTKDQLNSLPQILDTKAKPFRLLCQGKAVCIATGRLTGGNIIHQPVYWKRPKLFIDMVLNYFRERNPDETFRITYH